jgi:hypothetical protein
MMNASDMNALILICIEDAIDERIMGIEGDVVHTDWDESDWEVYKSDNCFIRNAEDYLKCANKIEVKMIHGQQMIEFAEVSAIFTTILLKMIKDKN